MFCEGRDLSSGAAITYIEKQSLSIEKSDDYLKMDNFSRSSRTMIAIAWHRNRVLEK